MPGCGKTTLGRQLAEHMKLALIDTDHLIEQKYQQPLQTIMNEQGPKKFLEIETETLLGLNPEESIISTGGSAVYSKSGMEHLKNISNIIYLDVPLNVLKKRIGNFETRGLYKTTNQTLEQIFIERQPLYKKYAHQTITEKNITLNQFNRWKTN